MQAKVKCSECGAEISNLSLSWNAKQWLILVPFLLIALFPMWRLMRPKGDYREDLHVEVVESRLVNNYLEILGSIENKGKSTWDNIELDAEFYDADGKFFDEETGRVAGAIQPGETEQFKLKIYVADGKTMDDDIDMRVKVAHANPELF